MVCFFIYMSFVLVRSKSKGYIGEGIARKYLIDQGYEILTNNYINPYGEIDIVAQQIQDLVFVEVKLRKKYSAYTVYPISLLQQNRIKAAAQLYIENHFVVFENCRFDYIGITYPDGYRPKVFHLKQAF